MTAPDDPTETDLIDFRIVLHNGVTIQGSLPEPQLRCVIRDPSNLNSVVGDQPAGSAVSIVLPACPILEYSEDYSD